MVTAIRAAWLWLGTDSAPVRDGTVLIDGDKVVGAGPTTDLSIPSDARTVDRGAEFLMPGLIDAHTHMTIIPGLGNQSGQKRRPIERQAIRAASNLRRSLRAGVTTARIMGEEAWLDVTFRAEIEAGETLGPRLIVATRALTPSNGHGRAESAFDGVDEVRKGARQNLAAGADFLKMFLTGGISSTRGSLDAASYSRDEVRAAVEEAERAGTYVAAHAVRGAGIRLAAEEGIRTIEHAALATDEDLELIRDKGAWVVLTQAILLHETGIEQGDRGNAAVMERLHAARAQVSDRFRAIIASGVRYTIGTDSMHGLMSFEVARLLDWGASPRNALLAATSRAAECCRVDDRSGSLAPGKYADLISLGANPFENIAALEDVRLVIKAGRSVGNEELN